MAIFRGTVVVYSVSFTPLFLEKRDDGQQKEKPGAAPMPRPTLSPTGSLAPVLDAAEAVEAAAGVVVLSSVGSAVVCCSEVEGAIAEEYISPIEFKLCPLHSTWDIRAAS